MRFGPIILTHCEIFTVDEHSKLLHGRDCILGVKTAQLGSNAVWWRLTVAKRLDCGAFTAAFCRSGGAYESNFVNAASNTSTIKSASAALMHMGGARRMV